MGRRGEQSDQGVGSAAKFSQGKAGGRKDARDRQGVHVQGLFILHPQSGAWAPAEKAPSAQSQPLFCEVLIKKTNTFSFFNLLNHTAKNISPDPEED